MPPSLSGTVLKKKWRLGDLVGTGGCAEVYEATDVKGEGEGAGQLVAKIAPLPVGLPPAMSKGKKRKKTDQEKHADMIYYEYTLYKGFLLKHGGVVEIPAGGYGEDHNLRYLVMTRLGPDVEGAQELTGPWSVAQTAGYARQMLALLRSLHSECKMVFVDVKPENFMFGLPGSDDEDKIFLIDFGLSSRYTGPAGSIKPQSNGAQVQGTPEFLSLKCHGGASAGRCDDLESLGYVILSVLNAAASSPLPWSGSTSVASGLSTKKSTSLETLCKGFPTTMLQYMKAVRGLAYEDTPDYDALDANLEAMQKAGGKAAAAAKGGGRNSRSSARGTLSSSTAAATAKPRASSAKRGKGVPKETPEVEVCEVGVSRAGGGGSSTGRGSRRSKKAAAGAGAAASSAEHEGDEEEFFDAREEDNGDCQEKEEVLEVTKVAAGARRPTRGAASGAGAAKRSSRTVAADQGFLLEVVSGPHKGDTLRLPAAGAGEDVRVGRNAPRKNGLRLNNDLEVSDKHAVLRVQADGIRCEDVGSLNGVFVNEDRLEGSTVLLEGDTLQVGQSAVKITR